MKAIQYTIHALLAVAFLAAAFVTGITHDAPLGGFVRISGDSLEKPVNVPTWEAAYAERFEGCAEALPEGEIPASVVVVRLDGSVERMGFDAAYDRGQDDNRANDVWTVGQCR